MTLPFHRVNTFSGTKSGIAIEEPWLCAGIIGRAKRPLLVVGPLFEPYLDNDKPAICYILELAQAANIPVCATATVKRKLAELGVKPDSVYDAVEIVDFLKEPDWRGVKGEGNHDLVIFFGIRSDLLEQCLSVLKHFAFGHLRTMTLDGYYFPHANYSLPNFRRQEHWRGFLEGVIRSLKRRS